MQGVHGGHQPDPLTAPPHGAELVPQFGKRGDEFGSGIAHGMVSVCCEDTTRSLAVGRAML